MKRHILFLFFVVAVLHVNADNHIYTINDMFSFSISDRLEMRAEDDIYTHFLNDTLHYDSGAEAIFQQSGLSNKNREAEGKYCRIIVNTSKDASGEFPACDDGLISQSDLDTLVSYADYELGPGQRFTSYPVASVETNDMGFKYVDIHYTRTGYNGDVCVDICYFFNYDEVAKIVLSYRQSEEDEWKAVLDNARNTFTWQAPYRTQVVPYETTTGTDTDSESTAKGIAFFVVLVVLLLIVGCIFYSDRKSTKITQTREMLKQVIELARNNRITSAGNLLKTANNKVIKKSIALQSLLSLANNEIHTARENTQKQLKVLAEHITLSLQSGDFEKAYALTSFVESLLTDDIPADIQEQVRESIKAEMLKYKKEENHSTYPTT